jgi:hypothetical protein
MPPKNLARKANNHKKQTRLKFDPLDRSSSPASNGMSPANVRYELSGARIRRTPSSLKISDRSGSHDNRHSNNHESEGQIHAHKATMPAPGLPTPVKSSQAIFEGGFLGKRCAYLIPLNINSASLDQILIYGPRR